MENIVSITNALSVAARLKQARLATGLSIRTVADEIAAKWPYATISHTTLAKYESGATSPPVKTLEFLAAIYGRPVEWFLEIGLPLQGVRYRSGSRVLVGERSQYESLAQHWLEAYSKLEKRLKQHLEKKAKIRPEFGEMSPDQLAAEVRRLMKIEDNQPVFSVISVLEHFGVRVIELAAKFKIDGLAAILGDENVVVLNPTTANDRGRINAAHELGHILYGDCKTSGKTTPKQDDRAFEFAVSLLIPHKELAAAFKGRSAVQLVEAKEKFGISMAAMIYRAEKTGVITERIAKQLWIQFAKRGWRAKEPGNVRADKAIRFEKMLDSAISERRIKLSEACELMRVSRDDLTQRLNQAMGINVIEEPDDSEGGEFMLRLFK